MWDGEWTFSRARVWRCDIGTARDRIIQTCPFAVLDGQPGPVGGQEQRQQMRDESLRDLPQHVAQQQQHGHEADDGETEHDGFGHDGAGPTDG